MRDNRRLSMFSTPQLVALLSLLFCMSQKQTVDSLQLDRLNIIRDNSSVRLDLLQSRLQASLSTAPTTFSSSSHDGEMENLHSSRQIKQRQRRNKSKQSSANTKQSVQKKHHSNQKSSSLAVIAFNKELQQIIQKGKTLQGTTVAQQAQDLLEQRINQDRSKRSYDTISFNIVLQAWARQHSLQAAQAADRLLARLLQMGQHADSYSYAAVLHAYAKSGGKKIAAKRASEILEQLERSSLSQTLDTDICHNACIDAWAVSGDERAGERAEQLLRKLSGSSRVQPTKVTYNACIKAWAKTGNAVQAQRLLDEMKELSKKGDTHQHLAPDKISYTSCINAWSKSHGSTEAAQKAEQLLAELEQAYSLSKDDSMKPDVVSYTSVLTAYAKSGQGQSADMAMKLLDRMYKFAKEKPNAVFLNAWIHLLSKAAKSKEAGPAAVSILQYMRSEYESGNTDLQPCVITYTAVISVLAQAGTVASAEQAETLLSELESLWASTGDCSYLPNAKTFACVLHAWAKSASPQAVEKSEMLLRRMEGLYEQTKSEDLQANLIVYSQALHILAGSRDPNAATRAKDLIKHMNDLHKAGNKNVQPDATTYAYLINTFTKSGVENAAEIATRVLKEVEDGYRAGIGQLKPTELLYSAVLQAYAKSASQEGAKLAENLLQRTKKLYQEGKVYAKPSVLFYNAAIDAYARSRGGRAAAERAEDLFLEMEARSKAGDPCLRPNARTFNAAILAWKNSNDLDAPQRAEALLKKMNNLYKNGDASCRPDRVTFNSIISVWATCPEITAAERAEQFLVFMENAYKNNQDETLKPDSFSYNSCINAYSKSKMPGAARKATDVYNRMVSQYVQGDSEVRPDIISLTALRNAWMKSNHDEQDLAVAKHAVDRIEQLIKKIGCNSSDADCSCSDNDTADVNTYYECMSIEELRVLP